jgi:regulator of replication initiation timing
LIVVERCDCKSEFQKYAETESEVNAMGLYLEKIEENEKKIKKLKATIEKSKAKLKKLVDENAHLSYLEIKAEYNCEGRELLEVLAREREQSAKLKADSLADSDNDVTADTAEDNNSDTDNSDDEFGQQMSFTDKRNPFED